MIYIIDNITKEVELFESNQHDINPKNFKELNALINWENTRVDWFFANISAQNSWELHSFITVLHDKFIPFWELYIDIELLGKMYKYQIFEKEYIKLEYYKDLWFYGYKLPINYIEADFNDLVWSFKIYYVEESFKDKTIYKNVDMNWVIHDVKLYQDIDMENKNEIIEEKKEKTEKKKKYNQKLVNRVDSLIQKFKKVEKNNNDLIKKLEKIIVLLDKYTEKKPKLKNIISEINEILKTRIKELQNSNT